MKKLIVVTLSVGLLLGAQNVMAQAPAAQVQESVEKQAVALADLPKPIQDALASDANKDFKAESATVNRVGEVVVFEVTGKRNDATEVLRFDQEGKLITN